MCPKACRFASCCCTRHVYVTCHLCLCYRHLSRPAPDLGQEMSLFAAALEAQDGISSRSMESEDDFKPAAICHDGEAAGQNSTATVGYDDEAAGHNSTATIGNAVPAYRFMTWLDGEPTYLRWKIDVSFVEMLQMSKMWLTMKMTIYHSNLAKVAS
jgi:hypothetical protein